MSQPLPGMKIGRDLYLLLVNHLLMNGVGRERIREMVSHVGSGAEYLGKDVSKAKPPLLYYRMIGLVFFGCGVWALVYFFYLLHVGFAETTLRQWCSLAFLCFLCDRSKKSILRD